MVGLKQLGYWLNAHEFNPRHRMNLVHAAVLKEEIQEALMSNGRYSETLTSEIS